MFEDLITTIKAQLYERAISPLIGSFCISWIIINWRFIFILLSDGTPADKLIYIDLMLYPKDIDKFTYWLAYPSLSVIFISFILPWPSRKLYEYAKEQQILLKNIQIKLEEKTPLPLHKANKIRKSAMESAIENEKVQERLREEIETLKSMINELENDKNLEELSSQKKTSMNSLQKEISELGQQNSELLEKLREAYSQQSNSITPSPHAAGLAAITGNPTPKPE